MNASSRVPQFLYGKFKLPVEFTRWFDYVIQEPVHPGLYQVRTEGGTVFLAHWSAEVKRFFYMRSNDGGMAGMVLRGTVMSWRGLTERIDMKRMRAEADMVVFMMQPIVRE